MQNFFFGCWQWLSLGLVFFILEMLMGANFFLLGQGSCALLLAGVLKIWPGLDSSQQIMLFSLFSLLSIIIWYWFLPKRPSLTNSLNRRAHRYIGQSLRLDQAIKNGLGKVRIEDSYWTVQGSDAAEGSLVKIVDVDGTILLVKPA